MAKSLKDNQTIKRIKQHLKITKVVCTRSVKGPDGDHYVGFSSAWDTIQDDGGGSRLTETMDSGDAARAVAQSGMTLQEAEVAALILGMQADIAAHDHAAAGGSIAKEHRDMAVRSIRANYSKLIVASLGLDDTEAEVAHD